ncbi:hypothetical protein ACFXKD_04430 [Nocardiopsis aegyptia]|uniref:hypothetical protein n=1 Tax=Nocardiopsis aegyptia TaxID=220378 RepID=UPI00366B4467
MELEEILRGLVHPTNLTVRTGEKLVGSVEAAVAKDDERFKGREEEPPRRKPRLMALPCVRPPFPVWLR